MTSSTESTDNKKPATTAYPKSDFSIEHILTRAGSKSSQFAETGNSSHDGPVTFSWLNCTRYCPPKLPRSQKKECPQKRQLGRHPRIPFSSQQLAVLEEKFKQSPYLSSAEVTQLSRTLQLADIRVKIWFQNRRARERRERNEHEVQLKPYTNELTRLNVKTEYSLVIPLPPSRFIPVAQSPETLAKLSNQSFDSLCSTQSSKKLDFRNISCFIDKKGP